MMCVMATGGRCQPTLRLGISVTLPVTANAAPTQASAEKPTTTPASPPTVAPRAVSWHGIEVLRLKMGLARNLARA